MGFWCNTEISGKSVGRRKQDECGLNKYHGIDDTHVLAGKAEYMRALSVMTSYARIKLHNTWYW